MSSLLRISHHLFVAAAGNEGRAPARTAQSETRSMARTDYEKTIPLELIERDSGRAGAMRQLRTSMSVAR